MSHLEPLVEQPPVVELHTADGLFIKQMYVAKAGTYIPQHSHAWDHTSMLATGSVRLWADGVLQGDFFAPAGILIEAGVKHLFLSLEDETTVYCIHNLHGEEAVKVLAEHQIVDAAE